MPRPDASDKLAPAAPARASNRTLVGVVVGAVAVIAVVVAILMGQGSQRTEVQPTPSATQGSTTTTVGVPQGATGFGGPMLVNASAPASAATLDVYSDPQCPICAQFEAFFGSTIADLVEANQVKLLVHTMTFLDANLKNDSSRRAANAMMCAADQGVFLQYQSAVFAGQPAREGEGFTDAKLAEFARTAGLSGAAFDAWSACAAAKTYAAHVDALEVNSEKAGITGTPTVLLNGTKVNLGGLSPADFAAKVRAASQ